MRPLKSRQPRVHLFVLLLAVAVLALTSTSVSAYTKKSPEVLKIVGDARKYLETTEPRMLGEKCVVALALAKAGAPESHPIIQDAVATCEKISQDFDQFMKTGGGHPNYNLGLALMFLCDHNPGAYRHVIERFVNFADRQKKPVGSYGYEDKSTGDTSQTQFMALGLWSAKRTGVEVPQGLMEDICRWLIQTQDPSGSWGYQGQPAPIGNRVKQPDVRASLGVAGLSSVYTFADLFGAYGGGKKDSGLPPGVVAVKKPVKGAYVNANVDLGAVRSSCSAGNNWFERTYNGYGKDTPPWTFIYHMYGVERYQSFRELVEDKKEKEPRWYNDGVKFLQDLQNEDGSFKQHYHATADTSFAILFLLRSTQDLIERSLGAGELTGGRGLPADLASARVKNGKIVGAAVSGSLDSLLSVLEDPEHSDFEALVKDPSTLLTSIANPEKEAPPVDRLRKLVTDGSYQARRVGVKSLARQGNLDNVPYLIYALTDPDPRVMREARDGLRFISRKFFGFGLPDDPDDKQVAAAIEKWKEWYLTIRPKAKFLKVPDSSD